MLEVDSMIKDAVASLPPYVSQNILADILDGHSFISAVGKERHRLNTLANEADTTIYANGYISINNMVAVLERLVKERYGGF